ncbi:Endonuclease/exonuclease/phosphatase [Parasponia andersonii]|uniref:Endonuclease/exonuclease/phosphatase n=1 Tax=Parasponia andersonii TaxID=3476 RepID=A0A2P5A4A0_PARAD|nr:Endonuclease/exonuclease/phosphatase [Parasponia andersonii]
MGGNYRAWTEMNKFQAALDCCHLQDIGHAGPKLTWDDRQEGLGNIQERLDQFTGTSPWQSLFPSFRDFYEDYWGSDHRVVRLFLRPILTMPLASVNLVKALDLNFSGQRKQNVSKW